MLANNPGDNKIYLEAFSADGSASASELLFTGRLSSNAPVISLWADKTNIRGDLDMNGHWINNAAGLNSPLGSDLSIDAGAGDIRTLHLMDEVSIYGNLNMNGHSVTNCGALTEANLQTIEERIAERIDRFEEGDVLCWVGERLEKCATANDRLVQAVADANGKPIIIGAEVVKVLGPVRYGDLLVASDVPGYAMVNNAPRAGTVIAQALQDFDGERGIIKAMIRKF